MKYALSCLILFVAFACHLKKPTQPTQRVECLSYEEPTCSACLRGDDESCQTLLDEYQSGGERARDLKRASFFWEQLFPGAQEKCKRDAATCEKIGRELWNGALTQRDTSTALRYFATAEELYRDKCEQRDIAACIDLAALYSQPGYEKPKEAIKIYEQMLLFGEGAALSLLRDLWLESHKSDKNFPVTTALTDSPQMEKLCLSRDLDACVAVGIFYQSLDPRRSFEFFLLACEEGSGRACFLAAQAKPKRANELLYESCKADFVEGCLAYFAGSANSWQHFVPIWQYRCQQGNKKSCELIVLPDGAQPFQVEAKQKLAQIAREDCIHGDGKSCMKWLSSARKERATPLVKPTVRRQVEEGCRDGIPGDCVRLASLLIPKEKMLARQSMERGCLLGSMEACVQLSSIVWWGEDSIENKEKTRYYGCLAEQLHPFTTTTNNCQPPN